MKMRILKGSKGELIATSELPTRDAVPVAAVVEEGQMIEEIEVPAEYIWMPATDFLKRLEADIHAVRLEVQSEEE